MSFELNAPIDDGEYTEDVGPWSADKHHFLRRYIDAFVTSMKDKPWKGLHYVDLFAGPGIVRIKDKGLDWGSPLVAAQAPHSFTQLHLCELGNREFAALSKRIGQFPQATKPQLCHGDANACVHEIVNQIPQGSLTLAFLDPHGLHLHFDTLRVLSERRADLIIFFPDHLDALRNWENVYNGKPDSNLDRVLGTGAWRERMERMPRDRWAEVLQKIYVEQLRTLEYNEFDDERITLPNGRFLYKLIFAAKHKTAVKLWRSIATKKPDGQSSFEWQ